MNGPGYGSAGSPPVAEADETVGNGVAVAVGSGVDVTVGNGVAVAVGSGVDVTVGNRRRSSRRRNRRSSQVAPELPSAEPASQ